MSLSSIWAAKEVRAASRGLVVNPRMHPKPPVRVPRASSAPQRVGTAFDYAFRFGLAARWFGRIEHLIAEDALTKIEQISILHEHRAVAHRHYQQAIDVLTSLKPRRALSRRAADVCYRLASLDVVFRALRTEQLYQSTTATEIEELQSLYSIVPWEEFRPRSRLILNPTFGEGSCLIGGADADLIMDDAVIEVKTVKEQSLNIDVVRQLTGYALLANEFGIDGTDSYMPLKKLGIYFSRAGVLYIFSLDEVIAPSDHQKVLDILLSPFARFPGVLSFLEDA